MGPKEIKVLIITKGSNDSGNLTTMSRISKNIEMLKSHIKTSIFNISNPIECSKEFQNQLTQWKPNIIMGLNLCRCLFISDLQLNAKIIMILGGTDINLDMSTTMKSQLQGFIQKCYRIVAFSTEMKSKFESLFLEVLDETNLRVDIIPQGVDVIDAQNFQHNHENDELLKNLRISSLFLVVGRLRSVKDPGFIVKPFVDWLSLKGYDNFSLLYVGDVEDKTEDIVSFLKDIEKQPNIHHIGSLSHDRVFNLMIRSKAVINCSKSEGQSVTLLEAMSLGIPVIARKVPGNIGLINNNYNGLLFGNEKEFMVHLTNIVNSSFSRSLVEAAKGYIRMNHNSESEALHYINIIDEDNALNLATPYTSSNLT